MPVCYADEVLVQMPGGAVAEGRAMLSQLNMLEEGRGSPHLL